MCPLPCKFAAVVHHLHLPWASADSSPHPAPPRCPPSNWGTLPKICPVAPSRFPVSSVERLSSRRLQLLKDLEEVLGFGCTLCGVPPWTASSERGFPIATSQPASAAEKCLIESTRVRLAGSTAQNLCFIKATSVTLFSMHEHLFLHSVKAFIQLLALSLIAKRRNVKKSLCLSHRTQVKINLDLVLNYTAIFLCVSAAYVTLSYLGNPGL